MSDQRPHKSFETLAPIEAYDPKTVLEELEEQIFTQRQIIENALNGVQSAFERSALKDSTYSLPNTIIRLEELVNARSVVKRFSDLPLAYMSLNPKLDLAQQILAKLDTLGTLFPTEVSAEIVPKNLAQHYQKELGIKPK